MNKKIHKILAIDAASGLSGDMFVAAAAMLANCEQEVIDLPQRLGFPQVIIQFSDCQRAAMACRHCAITIDGKNAENAQEHHHRHLSTIQKIIQDAQLEKNIEARALRMFQRLAEVEAKAHGIAIEKVHFHEVGAIDSIIDIVASALCIQRLNISTTYASDICVGFGTVNTAHGELPIPAPATDTLLQGMPTHSGDIAGEWCTPTGALILCELQPQFHQLPSAIATASCFGAGNKNTQQRANAVRLRLLDSTHNRNNSSNNNTTQYMQEDEITVLHSNIDDSTGEQLGSDFFDILFTAGAKDVTLSPCLMKKGRPAQQLEVLCDAADASDLAAAIMNHSSSIGVRSSHATRYILERSIVRVHCQYGDISCKKVCLPNGNTRLYPEYEDCVAAARENNIAVIDVYRAALAADNHKK